MLMQESNVQERELRTQNASLRAQLDALQVSHTRYFEYYDRAPVGYLMLCSQGRIQQLNATAISQLGLPRKALAGRALAELVSPEDLGSYLQTVQRALESDSLQSCDLRMQCGSADPWWANLRLIHAQDPDGQAVLRTVLSDVGERKRLETLRLALSLRVEELSHSLVLGQEEARRRFSRELHDRTSPNLAALRINLDLIALATPQDRETPAYSYRIEDTRALIEDTTVSVRDICSELHPPVLESGGLLSVVQSYVLQFARRTGIKAHVQCLHADLRLSPDLEISLFRILQEALANCAKHASASVVLVNLQLDTLPMLLSVHDNGSGFDPDLVRPAAPGEPGGHGLRNMKETAEFIGARFILDSVPGLGTRVLVEL